MAAWVRLNSQLRSSGKLGAAVLIFANLFFASQVALGQSLQISPSNCGLVLGGTVIFCDTFDTVNSGIPSRTGALDPNVWGVSRTTGNTSLGALANDWAGTLLQSCTGQIGPVLPPNDIVICNGQLREATNDNVSGVFDDGTVVALTMYPKQPFDFAGRTGTVSFDVSNDSEGSHAAWPEFWITSLPIPGPFAHFLTWQSLPQFGFGIRLDGYMNASGAPDTCPEGAGHIGVGAVILINNYIGNDTDNAGNTVSVQGHACVASSTGPGNMNHFEFQVSQNQIDVYGTDAGVTPTAATLKHLATISNANLGFTRGLVWIDDVHYNADKGGTPSQRQHTFSWDNIAFDGPFVYRDFSYDALDNNTPDANGSVDLGKYALAGSSTSWNVLGMPGSPNPAATRVLFNFYHAAPPANLLVTVNGHAHIVPWPYPDMLASTWRTFAVTIPTTDLVAGINVVTIGSPDQAINVANDNIVLVDVPGGVPVLPGNSRTYPIARIASHDLNGDGKSDLVWRDSSGNVGIWLMNGNQLLQGGGLGNVNPNLWKIVGQRDFDGDGKADLLWNDTSGNIAIWFMNGAQVSQYASAPSAPGWTVVGTGDFNGDGKGDILWEDANHDLAIWLMNGTQVSQAGGIGTLPSGWSVAGTGDFDRDGKTDILFQNGGSVAVWFMNGVQVSQFGNPPGATPAWSVVGTGDFNGDGYSDILWRDTSDNLGVWLMQGTSILQAGGLGNVGSNWTIAETGDINGDGKSDILYRETSAGSIAMWYMNGIAALQYLGAGSVPLSWTIQGSNSD
jgi:hypothetical protein